MPPKGFFYPCTLNSLINEQPRIKEYEEQPISMFLIVSEKFVWGDDRHIPNIQNLYSISACVSVAVVILCNTKNEMGSFLLSVGNNESFHKMSPKLKKWQNLTYSHEYVGSAVGGHVATVI